ncbi:MAG TPA: DUF3108 domain-containing protein [bacterium]|jgi:hypothetical protein|nr:DUF3108 domain-containing protein [bacterium]
MRALAPAGLALLAVLCGACAQRGTLITRSAVWPSKVPTPLPSDTPTPTPPPMRTVKARGGDCLWNLSRRWLGTGFRWPEIAQANHLMRPWTIAAGQALQIPPSGPKPKASPVDFAREEARRYGWVQQSNRAYTVGEKLTFAVQYGGLTAGYATLSIPEVLTLDGRPVFHIVAEARSLPFFDAFFRVHDILDSYSDVDYGFSWGYEKHIREGGFKADASYNYDQRRGLILEPAKGTQAFLPPRSQDVLSCFYYFRTQPMTVGSVVDIPVTADDMKNYRLTVNVLRKERVSTLAGDFDCVVVQPHLSFKGVFRQKGDVFLWISDDERRLPVLIRSRIIIGSININLQNAQWVRTETGAVNEQAKGKGH